MIEINDIKAAYDKLAKEVKFKCLGCGKCGCKSSDINKIIILMSEEEEILKEKDKMHGIAYCNRLPITKNKELIPTEVFAYLKIISGRCSFFNKKNKCEIHEYKPLICFLHPFQVFMTGFAFGGGMIFDTKCSWVQKHRKRLDNPSKKVLEAYNYLYSLVMKYKEKKMKLI